MIYQQARDGKIDMSGEEKKELRGRYTRAFCPARRRRRIILHQEFVWALRKRPQSTTGRTKTYLSLGRTLFLSFLVSFPPSPNVTRTCASKKDARFCDVPVSPQSRGLEPLSQLMLLLQMSPGEGRMNGGLMNKRKGKK